MPPALAVRGLEKRYGSVQALDGVDLEVGEGELVGLLGPNGAGKSTLVKIACGLVRPSAGGAEIRGRPASSPAARAELGYLAELFRFPGWYRAWEVLALHQRLSASTGGAGERDALLALVGLADAGDRRVEEMSKGMQQRLGIAQALVGEPRVLLLDEPTSALDVGAQQQVLELVASLRADHGLTVLSAMHDLTHAGQYADRLLLMDGGREVAAGLPHEVLTEQLVARHYGAEVRIVADEETGIAVVPLRPGVKAKEPVS